MPVVEFAPFSSLVQPAFWHGLTSLKIDILRLSEDSLPISASYSLGRSIKDRETGQDIALGCNLSLGQEAFEKSIPQLPPNSVPATGFLKNYNTIEDFKAADKKALFNQTADEIWQSIITKRDPSLLTRFLLITFADLKKYKYFYWFAFPAFVAKPVWEISDPGWKQADQEISQDVMISICNQVHLSPSAFFLVKVEDNQTQIAPLEKYDEFFAAVPPSSQLIAFFDPSSFLTNPGWPLRNLLAYLSALYPNENTHRILCWRDSEIPTAGNTWKSRFGVVYLPSLATEPLTARPSAVGWEKNVQGKLGARMADLAPMMDPTRLADQAVDLNLKLMRWRILPSLNLEKVAATKCLLLGAGTLGCYVSRVLMGWGVRNITFVDSALVSFSNPVRQPLFEFEDSMDGGKIKALCAAERLKKIFPGVNANGYNFSIPMPGHPIPPSSLEQTKKDVALLEKLIDDHDAVFLLMDSRESRWLPTVICASKGKIVLNAALGFDTYLVMRHGTRASSESDNARLGCYYCNDIVAPADSLTDRTLDQMCTVTRPGLASIAASTAVELLVSMIQHPDGINAPPPLPSASPEDAATAGSILGMVPHQIRGFLAQFRNIPITGAAFDRCTGCSETVIRAYENDGFGMMLKAFNEQGYLESLTGLDKLYDEGEAAMEAVDWDEDDDEM